MENDQSHSENGENDSEILSCYSVNRYMIPAKIAYLVSNARYAITDYFMLFYISIGLSPTEAGLVNGLQYLGGLIANPLWGLLADYKGSHRLIVIFLCVMAIISVCIQPFISANVGNPNNNVCPIANHTTKGISESGTRTTDKTLFYSLLIAAIFASSFDGSIMSFIDAGVLRRLELSPRRANIGVQRYAGSVGTSLGSIAYSFSINYFPTGPISCYAGIFITYMIFAICTGTVSCFLFQGVFVREDGEVNKNVKRILIDHLKGFDTLIFLFTVLFNGIVQALNFSFVFLYLKELHAPTLLLGFSISLNSVSAVTVYVLSAKIIRFLRGPMNAMCFSCFAWALRLLCTALLTNPFAIFAIDIFHGFTYSLFRVASLQYIKETTNEEIVTTMCGIVNSLYLCFSFLIANVIGGHLYEVYGAKKLFFGTSLVCVLWVVITVVYILVKRFKRKGYQTIRSKEQSRPT